MIYTTTGTELKQLWFVVNQPGRAANPSCLEVDSLESRLLFLQLQLWNFQLTILSAKFCLVAFKGIKVFFLRHSSFLRLSPVFPPLQHLSQVVSPVSVMSIRPSRCISLRNMMTRQTMPTVWSPSVSHLTLIFSSFSIFLSCPFLFLSLHCCIFCTFWPIQYFQSCFFLPGCYVVLAKFPSLFSIVMCFLRLHSACCPPFPKYLLVILHNREQQPNIRVLLRKCDCYKNISKKRMRHGK